MAPVEPPPWAEVALSVYELHGATMVNTVTEAVGLGGAYHVGLEVYWLEWSYGFSEKGTGVHVVHVGTSRQGVFKQRLPLGRTQCKPHDVMAILSELRRAWRGQEYDLLRRNCVHFCTELAWRLQVHAIPGWVGSLAATGDWLSQWLNVAAGYPEAEAVAPEPERAAAARPAARRVGGRERRCIKDRVPLSQIADEPLLVKIELEWRWAKDYVAERELVELRMQGAKGIAKVLSKKMVQGRFRAWAAVAPPRIQIPRRSQRIVL
mmetsp:Transcript_7246/g.22682  ORF Transcript_7246/g.22682 Transcript_7246/m.22682 type:complete len:264 (-) Transcript_7246:31-822(-)